jgi:hypothetical protein
LRENRPPSRAVGIHDEGLRHGLTLGVSEYCHARRLLPATQKKSRVISRGKKIAAHAIVRQLIVLTSVDQIGDE